MVYRFISTRMSLLVADLVTGRKNNRKPHTQCRIMRAQGDNDGICGPEIIPAVLQFDGENRAAWTRSIFFTLIGKYNCYLEVHRILLGFCFTIINLGHVFRLSHRHVWVGERNIDIA